MIPDLVQFLLDKDPKAVHTLNNVRQTPFMAFLSRRGNLFDHSVNPRAVGEERGAAPHILSVFQGFDLIHRLNSANMGFHSNVQEPYFDPPSRVHSSLQVTLFCCAWIHPSAAPDDWRHRLSSGFNSYNSNVNSVTVRTYSNRVVGIFLEPRHQAENMLHKDVAGNTVIHYLAAYSHVRSLEELGWLAQVGEDDLKTQLFNFDGLAPQHLFVLQIASSSSFSGVLGGGAGWVAYNSIHRDNILVPADRGSCEFAKFLFPSDEMVQLRCRNASSETCLHLLLKFGSIVQALTNNLVSKQLLPSCINVADDNGTYPIHLPFKAFPAISSQPVYSFLTLLQAGGDPFVVESSTGFNIMHLAAQRGMQKALWRMYLLGLIRADNGAQWCVPDSKMRRTPLHYLALTSLDKLVSARSSDQLIMFYFLLSLAGAEAGGLRDCMGCTAAEYLGRTFRDPASVELPPMGTVIPLEKNVCCHAYVASVEDYATIRAVWQGVVPIGSCDGCKKAFTSSSHILRGVESGKEKHAECFPRRSLAIDSAGKVTCNACDLEIPETLQKILRSITTEAAGRPTKEHEAEADWRMLDAARNEPFILSWVLGRIEHVEVNAYANLHGMKLKNQSVGCNGLVEKTFQLPVGRVGSHGVGNHNNNGFGFPHNNNHHLVLPRSRAAKKYDRARLKTALAVGTTVGLRNNRIAQENGDGGGGAGAGGGGGFGGVAGAFGGGGGGGGYGGAFGAGFGGGGMPGGMNNAGINAALNNSTYHDFK
jgi:hypothetical protein